MGASLENQGRKDLAPNLHDPPEMSRTEWARQPFATQNGTQSWMWPMAARSHHLKRKGRDSNPRTPFGVAGFQDRCNRPLCHPSRYLVFLSFSVFSFSLPFLCTTDYTT